MQYSLRQSDWIYRGRLSPDVYLRFKIRDFLYVYGAFADGDGEQPCSRQIKHLAAIKDPYGA